MRKISLMVTLLLLAVTTIAQSNVQLQPLKRGTTFQATIWPSYYNNWAGRFSCNNCNPYDGDVLCNRTLPILCINFAKTLSRPLYKVHLDYTPFTILDGGYYDAWTGGVFEVTVPVRGSDISSYEVGDKLCKGYFGDKAKFAEFRDGYYNDFMNIRPHKAWNRWSWAGAKQGAWNFWGYFNHHYRGRAWIWVNGQNNANCA